MNGLAVDAARSERIDIVVAAGDYTTRRQQVPPLMRWIDEPEPALRLDGDYLSPNLAVSIGTKRRMPGQ
jgi:hypothetical protein